MKVFILAGLCLLMLVFAALCVLVMCDPEGRGRTLTRIFMIAAIMCFVAAVSVSLFM